VIVYQDVMPFTPVEVYWSFEGMYWLQFQQQMVTQAFGKEFAFV
jgi:hypothetical protein